MKARFIVVVALATIIASEANAWNSLGHRVVAELAWRRLKPAERQEVVDTLRRHPRFDEDFAGKMTDDVIGADKALQDRWIFQHAAYWPDIARGLHGEDLQRFNRPTWHYVTNPMFLDETDQAALLGKLRINNSARYPSDTPSEAYNVLQAIAHSRAALTSNAGPNVRAVAYCWLLHLVGDIHQPLHSTSLYSVNQLPDGDRGGNSIPLAGGENLHSRWDGLLGRRDLIREVDRQANELSNRVRYRDVWQSAATETDPSEWARESHQLCKSDIYSDDILSAVRGTPLGAQVEPLRLSDEYMRNAGGIAKRRIIEAGARLGVLIRATSR
jgi:hypothetical protein